MFMKSVDYWGEVTGMLSEDMASVFLIPLPPQMMFQFLLFFFFVVLFLKNIEHAVYFYN